MKIDPRRSKMLITDIASFDKNRRRIYIDYEYAFPLYLSELKKFGIKSGTELSEDIYAEIIGILERRVKERILYLIGDTDRTEKDIREKLRRSGYVGAVADRAVESLKEYGYIDDSRYTRIYAETMRDGRNKSRRAIEAALCAKGVRRDVISDVMEEMDFDEEGQIIKALAKKGHTPETLSSADPDTKRRIYGFLARRGFSHNAISNIIRK